MKNQKKNKKLKKKRIRNTRKKRGNNNHKQKGDNKMKNKNKINDFIMKWIYKDLDETYWENDLWVSVKKGSLRDSITLDHELVDEMDYDYEKVWKDFWKDEHPFFNDLDKVMDKWRRELG